MENPQKLQVTRGKEAWVRLMEEARELHRRERAITLESVRLVGQLDREQAAVKMRIAIETLARKIGLSTSIYFKRAQAARVVHHYPDAAGMVERGETEISHLAMIAAKITPRNAEILLAGIRYKSRREVEQLLSVVTPDGRLLERESEVEIRVTLTKSQLERLDRAREVLSSGGKVPSTAEVLIKAVDELLKHRDPIAKAERASQRAERARHAAEQEGQASERAGQVVEPITATGHEKPAVPATSPAGKRTAVPAAIYHAVVRRDQGRCREILGDGSRCPERMNLELDHVTPVCRGGRHRIDNLVLRCRRHNRHRAVEAIGEGYLVSWAESRKRAAERSPRP
jgi:hypothetical protein